VKAVGLLGNLKASVGSEQTMRSFDSQAPLRMAASLVGPTIPSATSAMPPRAIRAEEKVIRAAAGTESDF
jgi:hypothetical protein